MQWGGEEPVPEIQIRAFYGDWRTVCAKDAAKFVKHMMSNMPGIGSRDSKIERINEKHLRGTTVRELLETEKTERN